MVLTQENLQELKDRELDAFKAFISVCETLRLRYYILGGTLLGAVRHKGFIPWDDDIDVGMPRADYEVFCEKAQALLPEKYFLQNIHTEKEYLLNFSKIRDSETTYLESGVAHLNIHHGIFIDIFPLDGYPTEKEEKSFFFQEKIFMARLASAVRGSNQCPWWKSLVSYILMPMPIRKAVEQREKRLKSATQSHKTANYCGAWREKEIVPTEWYGEGRLVEFEGLQVYAPQAYDKWLSQVYGDYMQLPPEEKRVGHHFVDAFDMRAPYTKYTKERSGK